LHDYSAKPPYSPVLIRFISLFSIKDSLPARFCLLEYTYLHLRQNYKR
jgi:hypothetical protein